MGFDGEFGGSESARGLEGPRPYVAFMGTSNPGGEGSGYEVVYSVSGLQESGKVSHVQYSATISNGSGTVREATISPLKSIDVISLEDPLVVERMRHNLDLRLGGVL